MRRNVRPTPQDINVAAGLSSSASPDAFAAARRSLSAALGISIVAFVVQFGGLLSGATLFRDRLNLFHTVLHFFGGVLTAWFVVDGWGYLSYWCVHLRDAGRRLRGLRYVTGCLGHRHTPYVHHHYARLSQPTKTGASWYRSTSYRALLKQLCSAARLGP